MVPKTHNPLATLGGKQDEGLALEDVVVVDGDHLSIADIVAVARDGKPVKLTDDLSILSDVDASRRYILQAVADGKQIYGVTSGFGGMAGVHLHEDPQLATDLQNNLIWFQKTGAGPWLSNDIVRAAMLIRANSHLKGASGLRLQLIQRMVVFLNAGVTPKVHSFGSIGASGDLTPLASVTGALIGLDESFLVDYREEQVDCLTALRRLGLERLILAPKEGLAMINGTSVLTASAALSVFEAKRLLELALGAHALYVQALRGSDQSFHPFIHSLKPHSGQLKVAEHMLVLLDGSKFVRHELEGRQEYASGELVQDRYSLRCLPQYLGPIVDGLEQIESQVMVEANSATDNPLIDIKAQQDYHGGNFLGEYVAIAMDQLRYYIGMVAKHLDVQVALLVTPEFSNGLPPSLVGNAARKVNMGLKGLQISGNSLAPLLSFYGNSLADRFPTHAEQFNQNINSQGFGSAYLTRQSMALFRLYLSIALIFAVQAVDLRAYSMFGDYNTSAYLSPATASLYEAVKQVLGRPSRGDRPLVYNDHEQSLDDWIAWIAEDIESGEVLSRAMEMLPSLFH